LAAIGQWARDAPQRVLAALGVRRHRRQHCYVAPGEATVRRVLQTVAAGAVDGARIRWHYMVAFRGRRVERGGC
jgi:hypothetical protein